MASNLVSDVKVYGGKGRIAVQWNNPDAGTYTGIKIVYKVSGTPANHTDGTVIDLGMTGAITYPDGQEEIYQSYGLVPPENLHVITGLVETGTAYGVAVYSYNGATDGAIVAAGDYATTQIISAITFVGIAYTDTDKTATAPDGWKVGIMNSTTSTDIGAAPKMTLPYSSSDPGGYTSANLSPTATNDLIFPGDEIQISLYDASDTVQYTSSVIALLNTSGNWNALADGYLLLDAAPAPAAANQLPPPPVITAGDNPATTSDITPVLTWNASLDPEGQTVNYAIEIDSVNTFDSGIDHKLFKSVDAESVNQFQFDLNGDGNWVVFPSNLLGVTGNSSTKIRFEVPSASFLSEKRWYWRVYATDNQTA